MPARSNTCKVTATLDIQSSFIYEACAGPRFTDQQALDYYRANNNKHPTEYNHVNDYIEENIDELVKTIITDIAESGMISRHDDEDPNPWNFPISQEMIDNIIASVDWEVSADMTTLTVRLANIPEFLKYAYQYFDDHDNSTQEHFMAACQDYPRDRYFVDKTREWGDSGFTEFSCIYTGGKFYDLEIYSYNFFY